MYESKESWGVTEMRFCTKRVLKRYLSRIIRISMLGRKAGDWWSCSQSQVDFEANRTAALEDVNQST